MSRQQGSIVKVYLKFSSRVESGGYVRRHLGTAYRLLRDLNYPGMSDSS